MGAARIFCRKGQRSRRRRCREERGLGRGSGERRELPSGVRGGAPAADVFFAYFRVRNRLW